MYETSIKNMLNRFRLGNISDEDIETTIRDILWNVQQIKDNTDV